MAIDLSKGKTIINLLKNGFKALKASSPQALIGSILVELGVEVAGNVISDTVSSSTKVYKAFSTFLKCWFGLTGPLSSCLSSTFNGIKVGGAGVDVREIICKEFAYNHYYVTESFKKISSFESDISLIKNKLDSISNSTNSLASRVKDVEDNIKSVLYETENASHYAEQSVNIGNSLTTEFADHKLKTKEKLEKINNQCASILDTVRPLKTQIPDKVKEYLLAQTSSLIKSIILVNVVQNSQLNDLFYTSGDEKAEADNNGGSDSRSDEPTSCQLSLSDDLSLSYVINGPTFGTYSVGDRASSWSLDRIVKYGPFKPVLPEESKVFLWYSEELSQVLARPYRYSGSVKQY